MCFIGAYMCHMGSSGLVRDLRSEAKTKDKGALGALRLLMCPGDASDPGSQTSPDDLNATIGDGHLENIFFYIEN